MKKLSYLRVMTLIFFVTGCAPRNDTATLSSMVGKNIRGDEIQTWLSKVGVSPEIYRFGGGYFYSFKARGICLRFDTTDTLTTIFIYSEGADDFRQYQGDLPFGLSFLLTRREIESVLGQPEKSGGDGVINYWARYTSKGIGITYNGKQPDDLNARIYNMSIDRNIR